MTSRRTLLSSTAAALTAACLPVKTRAWEIDHNAITCTKLAVSEKIDLEAMMESSRLLWIRESLRRQQLADMWSGKYWKSEMQIIVEKEMARGQ